MIDGRLRSPALIPVLFLLVLAALFVTTSCSGNESKARKAVEEYLKGQGATEIIVDAFYVDKASPEKAYAAATITYDFSSAKGKPQREFSGFILTREGNGWRVESAAKYTKEQEKAAVFLAGGK
jgi:hypothetical protein